MSGETPNDLQAVKRLTGQGSGQGWTGCDENVGPANQLKDKGWSGWSGWSGWNQANRFTREQDEVDDRDHTHGHHIYPDHPDHPDQTKKINGLGWSGWPLPTSTTLTAWPVYLLADPAEVVLRGELDLIEQEAGR